MIKEYLPSDLETKTLNFVSDEAKILEDYSEDYYDKLLKIYYLYRNYEGAAVFPFRNAICLPIAFSVVETVVPRMLLNPRKVALTARKEESKQYKEGSERILDYDFKNGNFQLAINDWVKRSCIYGTSLIGVKFVREKIKRPSKTWTAKLKKFFTNKWKVETREGVEACAYEPFRVAVDPDATSILDTRVLRITTYRTKQELKDNKEASGYKNTEFVTEAVISDDYIAEKRLVNTLNETQRGKINIGVSTTGKQNQRELARVDSYWVRSSKKYPLGRLIVTANKDKILLFDGDNPYWYVDGEFPFIETKDHNDPGEFWVSGEIEPIEALIYEKNRIRNRRLDSSDVSADKGFWINPQSENDMDENEFLTRPQMLIHGVEGKDWGKIDMGPVSNTLFNEEGMVKSDIQETTGVSDYSKGIGQKYETATGMMAMISEANQRFALKIQSFGQSMARLGKLVLQIEEAEMTKERETKILGENGELKFLKVKPSEISSDFDIDVNIDANPFIEKELGIRELTNVLTVIAGDPNIDKKPVLRAILKKIDILTQTELDEMFGAGATPEQAAGMVEGLVNKIPSKMKMITPNALEKSTMVGEGMGTAHSVQPRANAGTSIIPSPAKIPSKIPIKR